MDGVRGFLERQAPVLRGFLYMFTYSAASRKRCRSPQSDGHSALAVGTAVIGATVYVRLRHRQVIQIIRSFAVQCPTA
jgi:hypothetical protein